LKKNGEKAMQTTDHTIVRTRAKGVTPGRAAALFLAGLLQGAMIVALVKGLDVKIWPRPETKTQVEVLAENNHPPPPVPMPVNRAEPTKVETVQPPIFDIGSGKREGAITLPPPGPGLVVAERAAAGILPTHTTPPYPPLMVRLGAEGVVRLRLAITPQGTVSEAVVVRSSGYPQLDEAARVWVVTHWRYRPAMRGETAVASQSEVLVQFDLKNAH
jgi:periplasmic protein TonB